jgi:hypothetical protein
MGSEKGQSRCKRTWAVAFGLVALGWLAFVPDAHAIKTLCEGKVLRAGVGMDGGVIASVESVDGRVRMDNVAFCSLHSTVPGVVRTCQATLSVLEAAQLSGRSVILFMDEAQLTPATVNLCQPPSGANVELAPYYYYFIVMK